ncbi:MULTISPECIES: family 78 glycoside hydrolase catalytic domain [Chitinophagaceae]
MKKFLCVFIVLLSLCQVTLAQRLTANELLCESKKEPLGIDATQPRFSWKIKTDRRNTVQMAYRILVADNPKDLEKNIGTVWNSGKIISDVSIHIPFQGKKLRVATKYYWKVKVWDNYQQTSEWSAMASFHTGLFSKKEWEGAHWIGMQALPDSEKILPEPPLVNKGKKIASNEDMPILRKSFIAKKRIKNAYLFIAGLGQFELHLNGKKVGDHFLDPGWTNYQKEAQYVTFDVASLLQNGTNTIGVLLGNGFYFTPSGRYRKLKVAYGFPKMICKLLVQYQDGTNDTIVSDTSWSVAKSPITFSSIYGGEDYNATLEEKDWDKPSFTGKWNKAINVDGPDALRSMTQDPMKVMQTFDPIDSIRLNRQTVVYDFGQNASGIVAIRVKGNRGDTVRIIPAELLNEKKEANQKATGSPYYFTYILQGRQEEYWQPRFSYYGFRYAQVEILPVRKDDDNTKLYSIQMLHTRNAAAQAGTFSCSDTLFNRTFQLINWAIKSNMASVLTDCPHREKLGWLEQAHLMGNSVQYNFDMNTLFPKIVGDMREAQTDSGLIPEIAPEFVHFSEPFRDSPEWGSSSILVPWYLYQWYGDINLLHENYHAMQHYVSYLESKAQNGILMQGLSDWFDIGPSKSGFSQLTPQGLTATAMFHYDLLVMEKMARTLGKDADANRYASVATQVKSAFNRTFYNSSTHQYGTGSQAANAMAVYMQLVKPEDKDAVIGNIVKELEQNNYKLTAGDIGYRYLLLVLAEAGRSDIIYKMNNRSDVPGYGYQLKQGATALTESWQAYPSVSNNHLMLGHLMEWFYQSLAGIRLTPGAIGYKQIDIHPEIVGAINYANAFYESVYGTIKSAWKKEGKTFVLDVQIPPNASATLFFPKGKILQCKEQGTVVNISALLPYKIGSGTYHFEIEYIDGNFK